MNERIGELLVKENLLSSEQLLKAREDAASQGKRLGSQITALGFMDENELTEFVAKQYGVPSINLEDFSIEPEVLALIPEDVATKHNVVPVNRAGSTLILATAELADGSRITSHFLFVPQTRRFFGGRHPLCGSGVTSWIDLMKSPEAARAWMADSRPEPGP